jgi:hypothetical protein
MQDFQRVGVIFVHGIGEQRRYEHLDSSVRDIIRAIELHHQTGGPEFRVSVELRDAGSTAFQAEQNTWLMDSHKAPVRAAVRDASGQIEHHLFFHEVWWADANEPYSLGKQIRFWGWALSIWFLARKDDSTRDGYAREMDAPPELSWLQRSWVRLQLLWVSYVFTLGAFSIGLLVFLAKRLLDFAPFSPIQVFVNYLSALKLYNQKKRAGGGFLDARLEPPRVSVRRRMMRVMADVALARYDRWYIVAHSLGTVIAFNGLMETGHAWPNYLDQAAWRNLRDAGWAGPSRSPGEHGRTGDMLPERPLWLLPFEIVYRDRVFERFAGLFTLGSPLNKFAAIWPARVPCNKFPAIPENARWINFYDRTDPVSGILKWFRWPSFRPPSISRPLDKEKPSGVLTPLNVGFRSHWLLLYSHICYLKFDEKSRDHGVSGLIAQELLHGPGTPLSNRCYAPGDAVDWWRRVLVVLQWTLLFVAVALLGSWLTWQTFPWLYASAVEGWQRISEFFSNSSPS